MTATIERSGETTRHDGDCLLCGPDRMKILVPFLRLARSGDSAAAEAAGLDRLPDLSEVLGCAGNPSFAALHRIIPVVHERLAARGSEREIPRDLGEYLKLHALQSVARGMLQERKLKSLLSELDAAGIAVILLKGAAFQFSLYPASAPRLGGDLDLLVKGSDFSRVCALMARHMTEVFDIRRSYSHQTAFQWMFESAHHQDPIIEIHRAITSPYLFSISEDGLWASSRPHPAYGSELIRILSPEDNVLHLAVHAFRDLDYCTHNLLDAHEVWTQWKPDPSRLVERSRAFGATAALYYLLLNLERLMKTPVPQPVIDRLKPSKVRRAINERVLGARIIRSGNHYHPAYRLIQAISQLSMPDNPFRGLLFHMDYAKARVVDLYRS